MGLALKDDRVRLTPMGTGRRAAGVLLVATMMPIGPALAGDPVAVAVPQATKPPLVVTETGLVIPYLPPYANPGFRAAVTAQPAGAEFRASVGLSAAGAPAPAVAPAAAPKPAAHAGKAPAAAKVAVPKGSSKTRAAAATAAPVATPAQLSPAPAHAASAAGAGSAASATPVASVEGGDKGWPKLAPGSAATRVAGWSSADVALAKARCAHIMKTIDAVSIPEAPLRDGECGSPAPVRVMSIGRKPEVVLSPPALMTCDMAVALHDWLKKDVQPVARKSLGSEIVKIETMSDYSCRNAYGRARTRLSEHGRANALDVRGFVTAKADPVMVLENWGLTGREIAAVQAKRRHAVPPANAPRPVEEPASAVAAAKSSPAADAVSSAASAANAVGVLTRNTIVDGIARARVGLPGTVASPNEAIGLGLSRLGGPKPADVPGPQVGPRRGAPVSVVALPPEATQAGADARKALFLRQIHASACARFGTVLGPEANNAHRNHLHLDMAMRATGAFCQ